MTTTDFIRRLMQTMEKYSESCKKIITTIANAEPKLIFSPTEIKEHDAIIKLSMSDKSLHIKAIYEGTTELWLHESQAVDIKLTDHKLLSIHHLGSESDTITFNNFSYTITLTGVAIITHSASHDWTEHKCKLTNFFILVRISQSEKNVDTLQSQLLQHSKGKISAIMQTLKTMLDNS